MKKYVVILFSFFCQLAHSQTENTFFKMPQIIPSSPESSALYKVADIPIDFSSGSANIDIPFYTIKDGNISLPISISYNTSGIKVQDIAGMIGLGWNLNFGAIISVKQESSAPGQQVLNSDFKQGTDIVNGNVSLALAFCGRVVAGNQEKQTPEYYYQFGGYSGSFFYDINGRLSIKSDEQRLLIDKVTNGFRITSPTGIQYTFIDQERSTTSGTWSKISAYFITKIVDLSTNRIVSFKYKSKPIYKQYLQTQSLDYVISPNPPYTCQMARQSTNTTVTPVELGGLQIDSIKFSSGYVKFFSSNDRLDIDPTRITRFSVFNNKNAQIKSIALNQSYFVSTGAPVSNYNYRLKLDSLSVRDTDNKTVELYRFSYNTKFNPAYKRPDGLNCTGEDYWGYYNGKDSNNGMIPKDLISPSDLTNYLIPNTYMGDRKADSLYSQAFILNQIQYPSGGLVNFLYESNYVSGYKLGNVVGGLRVKKVTYYDHSFAGSHYSKYYKYIKGAIPLSFQNDYSFDKYKTLICYAECPQGGPCSVDFLTRNVYSNPIGTLAYLIVNPFYSQVEEYELSGDIPKQKTVYYYDTINQFWIQPIPVPEYGGQFVTEKSWLKKQLLKKTEYYCVDRFDNYSLVKKEEYGYTDNDESNPQIGVHVTAKNYYDYIGGDFLTLYPTYPLSSALNGYEFSNARNSHGSRVLVYKIVVDYSKIDSLVTLTNNLYIVGNNNNFNTNNNFYALGNTNLISSRNDTTGIVYSYPFQGKLALNQDTQSGIANDSLISKNIIAPVVLEQHYRRGIYQHTIRTNYGLWTSNNGIIVLPKTILYQQLANPIENRINYINYDNFGNLLTVSKENGPPVSYIWRYNQNYPVAEISNSKSNNAFYEDFEEGNGNVMNDSKTGHYSYSGSYSKIISGLDNGKYIFSYWQKAGNTWSLKSNIVNVSLNSFQIALNAQIDDIKFYPVDALMKTSTFDPLIGMTSSTDVKGNINFFGYDNFNRLKYIKDYQGNITKNILYNYNPSSLGTPNIEINSYFHKNDCPPNYSSSLVNYYVPAGFYYASTQDAANILAQNDVNENAQTYANNNGSCIINKPAITSNVITAKATVSLGFTSIPNCTNTLITYTNVSNGTVGASGSITSDCSSPKQIMVPTSPGTFRFTITCYSSDFPNGLTSEPKDVYFGF